MSCVVAERHLLHPGPHLIKYASKSMQTYHLQLSSKLAQFCKTTSTAVILQEIDNIYLHFGHSIAWHSCNQSKLCHIFGLLCCFRQKRSLIQRLLQFNSFCVVFEFGGYSMLCHFSMCVYHRNIGFLTKYNSWLMWLMHNMHSVLTAVVLHV